MSTQWTSERWVAEWYSRNKLDGVRRHIMFENGKPVLFHTRRAAKEWIEATYGYIRERPDLRAEPHGWHMPQARKAAIRIEVLR